MRLTVAQALVRFLAAQEIERDGERHRFFAGCFGIFGHGNLAGLGQALQQHQDLFPYHQARNEQAMVHLAAGYARQRNRLGAYACTTSVGPGATNMVTGAALATINRLPVLLLPGDTFATRAPHPVLQQLEAPHDATLSVNDCFKPVSRFFDRIDRPEQLVDRRARGDARADRPGRDRRGHARAAGGRPDRGVRRAGGVPRAARLDRLPQAARARRARPRGAAGARRPPPADRRRRRRDLRRGDRRAAPRSPTRPASRSAETQAGAARCAPTTRPRWARSAPPAPRRPTGWRARPTS